MAEEFKTPAIVKEVLLIVIQIDTMLERGDFSVLRALDFRHHLYNAIKRLELIQRLELSPASDNLESLHRTARRAFASLQDRLTLPTAD